mmetsp:Transcript_14840/g.41114  ORF Transcript_14840/g.41114 Transcript_14840/m.41114 type:complete len:449 (+) Transcript_14840:529-1875(+)
MVECGTLLKSTRSYVQVSCRECRASADARVVARLVVLAKASEHEGEHGGDHDCTSNGVAQGDWQHVLDERRLEADAGGGSKKTRWQEEHVGDGVLEADGDEGGDWKEDADVLACHVLGLHGQIDGEADEPVAQQGLDEDGTEGHRGLGTNETRGHGGSSASQHAAVLAQTGESGAAHEVGGEGEEPVAHDLLHGDLLLEVGGHHVGGIAREELSTGEQADEEVDGEEGREDELGEAWVGDGDASHVAGDGEGQHASHAHAHASVDGGDDGLEGGCVAVGLTLLGEDLEGLGRCVQHAEVLGVELHRRVSGNRDGSAVDFCNSLVANWRVFDGRELVGRLEGSHGLGGIALGGLSEGNWVVHVDVRVQGRVLGALLLGAFVLWVFAHGGQDHLLASQLHSCGSCAWRECLDASREQDCRHCRGFGHCGGWHGDGGSILVTKCECVAVGC